MSEIIIGMVHFLYRSVWYNLSTYQELKQYQLMRLLSATLPLSSLVFFLLVPPSSEFFLLVCVALIPLPLPHPLPPASHPPFFGVSLSRFSSLGFSPLAFTLEPESWVPSLSFRRCVSPRPVCICTRISSGFRSKISSSQDTPPLRSTPLHLWASVICYACPSQRIVPLWVFWLLAQCCVAAAAWRHVTHWREFVLHVHLLSACVSVGSRRRCY